MNEELTDKLQDAFIGLIDSATSAAEFVSDEIPQVLEQLLMWKMAFNGMWLSIGLIVTFFMIKFGIKGFKAKWDGDRFFGILLVSLSIVPIIICICSLTVVIQIWIAPKVYLIEYAANLVK